MVMYIYLMIGCIFEAIILLGHILEEVKFGTAYAWYELLIGAIIDIIVWPIIIILSIIFTRKSR